MLLLSACTAGSDDAAEGTISTAPDAPVSDFTVTCPEWSDPQTKPDDGKLPPLSLECLGSEGKPVAVSGKPPRPTVVNIWASWCPPCREEMPIIEQLAQAGVGKVDVLGVASSDGREAATAFAAEKQLSFPSVLDRKGQVAASQGAPGLPDTLFVDAGGKVVYLHPGPYHSLADLKADVQEHLKVTL